MQPQQTKLLISVLIVTSVLTLFRDSADHRIYRLLGLDDGELRYATFGTSRTGGVRLKNRHEDGYPFLLSSNVKDLSIRGSNACFASICTQTMVRNNNFDVIVIEYDRKEFKCLDSLVQRLRQRFPDASIILLQTWNLVDITFSNETGLIRNLGNWLIKDGFDHFATRFNQIINSKVSFGIVKGLIGRNKGIHRIAKKFNVSHFDWDYEGNVTDLLVNYFPYFADPVHWSKEGHKFIANGIKNILDAKNPERSDVLGMWDDIDFCSNWLELGHNKFSTKDEKSIINKSPSLITKHYNRNKKHFAIEFNNTMETSIQLKNPFNVSRTLYLEYLATFPNKLYPNMEVTILESANKTTIDTFVKDYNHPVHIQQSTEIGMLLPGINTIHFRPLDVQEAPFRLTGFMIFSGEGFSRFATKV